MSLSREFRFVLRSLAKSPVFVAVAVISLALGIGANAAVFTLLDQVLLRLLPVQDPQQLVQLKETGSFHGSNTGMNSLSYPIYKDFSEQNSVFSGMFCRYSQPFSVSFQGRSERASGELVSGMYFPVLGMKAALGRLFDSNEDRTRGGSALAVLGYDYWQTRFAGDPLIVGKQLSVNNHQLTVIGIAPRGFRGMEKLFPVQIFAPISMAQQLTQEEKPFDDRGRRWVQVFGRLKPGITANQAKASLDPIFYRILHLEVQEPRFAHASPYSRQQFLKMTLTVMPGGRGQDQVREFLEAPLWALMAMVGLVLLIACANVANLMIARATSRQKEIAVRLALGASRRGIVRQLLLESLLLSIVGASLGLAVSAWTMRFLVGIMPHVEPPVKFAVDPDLRVLGFSLAVAVFTAIIFGLIPALQATRPDVGSVLKNQGSAVVGGGQAAWRKLLVCAQVSLSLLLLIGAGLFVGTLRNLKSLNPGFEVNNLLSFSVNPTLSGYDAPRAKLFFKQLQERLTGISGVSSTALCVVPPLTFDEWDSTVSVEGYSPAPGEDMQAWQNYVSPHYFETLKIPLYVGRDFSDRDTAGAPKTVIVNEKFARHYFGSKSPIGRHIGMGGDPGTKLDMEIVGVVRDTRYQTMRQEPPPQIFQPYLQNTWSNEMTAYVRTDLASTEMLPVLRSVVQKMDANLPVYQMKTEESQRDDVLAVERLAANLATAFGVLATLLAAVGLYGVMAFLVARRSREIGLRMALGAVPRDVIWIVMREVLLLVGTGIAIGLPAALAVSRLLRNQLYGMSASDPASIAFAILGIVVIAAFSGYAPARRATRVDPISALRYE